MRKEYLNLKEKINEFESYATEMYEILTTTYQEVNKIDVNKEDPVVTEERLYNLILDMETRLNSVNGKINSVEGDMDRLRKEEQELYMEMQKKYPNVTQEQLKNAIQEHFVKKNLS
jgi:enoyl reductase-like protein